MGDSAAVAEWRQRMGTEEAKEVYKERAATAECVNAIARNRGLRQFTVRGLKKIKTVVLWYVLAHNLMRAHKIDRLRISSLTSSKANRSSPKGEFRFNTCVVVRKIHRL